MLKIFIYNANISFMPYGQILELMVALLLIGSAPENVSEGIPLLIVIFLFLVKLFAWIFFCGWYKQRTSTRRSAAVVLEWLALVPLIIDFYFLGLNDYIEPLSSALHLPSVSEFIGIFLFLLYLSMSWVDSDIFTLDEVQREHNLAKIKGKFRLILPVLLPYVLVMVLMDVLSQVPIPAIRALFSKEYSGFLLIGMLLIVFFFIMPGAIRRLWNCVPLPPSSLRSAIESALEKQGVKFTDILVWHIGEFMACTAAVVGLIPGFRYVLLTPCLMEYLSSEEIEAVLAHEAEHVRRLHIIWYLVLMFSFSAVIYVLMGPLVDWLLSKVFFVKLMIEAQQLPASLMAFLAVMPLGILFILYFRFIIGYFMRNFERQADLAVFKIHGHPFHLIDALRKVAYLSGIELGAPNWHHFSIKDRIDFLLRVSEDSRYLVQHEKKLLISKLIFLTTVFSLICLPNFLPSDYWRHQARLNSAEIYFNQFIKQHKSDPDWLMLAGSVFLKNKQYKMAERAFKEALKLDPDNPDIMNNLAWLYVKSEEKEYYRPKEALLLALEAARLKPAGYILDTLAECFFAVGYRQRAIEAEKRALKVDPKNASYYLKQLKRFQEASET